MGRRLLTFPLAAALLVACGGGVSDVAVRFERIDGAFDFGPAGEPRGREPFDALCADMDLDGDDDLLVNWHHLDPFELFENVGGVFRPVGREASGLVDNAGVPYLFADNGAMLERIGTAGEPGLYLWHGLPREGDGWRFVWKAGVAARVELVSNTRVLEVVGLAPGEYRISPDERTVQAALPAGERVVGLQTDKIASQLRLRFASDSGAPALFVGPRLERVAGPAVDLWKPDPHGFAWVDVAEDARPELYIARGALMGTLAPPAPPKRDRFFAPAAGAAGFLERFELVPPDYGRGRHVEWVDADGDGELELSLGNKETPNRLLDRGSAAFVDRAPELGLDLVAADVQAWGDFDGDGRDDLHYVAGDVLRVLRATEEGFVPAATLPLVAREGETIISVAALRLADFDNDGRLDLLLTGRGAQRANQLFLRRDATFEDVTARFGLTGLGGGTVVVLADWDDDAFVDAVSFRPPRAGASPVATLWRNRAGQRFEAVPLGDAPDDEIRAAAACDADGDGRVDLVAIGDRRHLLRNVTTGGNSNHDVELQAEGAAVGAVLHALYADGTVRAQRWGSAANSAYGQSLPPLRVASPRDNPLESIRVRWPGDIGETVHEIPTSGRRAVLRPTPAVPAP